MPHSLAGIFHSFSARFKTRKSSLVTLSSVGKWLRVLTALRSLAFRASMAFVTGMRSLVPTFGHDQQIVAYGATIRDRGTGSTKVRAGRSVR
jgi:hypothetical protein